ncbi:hypothetical protein PMAYCL1PPCAC_10235, partial [Pristionchus mayeri]
KISNEGSSCSLNHPSRRRFFSPEADPLGLVPLLLCSLQFLSVSLEGHFAPFSSFSRWTVQVRWQEDRLLRFLHFRNARTHGVSRHFGTFKDKYRATLVGAHADLVLSSWTFSAAYYFFILTSILIIESQSV